METIRLTLTLDEAILLDGKVSDPKVQAQIDWAKQVTAEGNDIVAKIKVVALTTGALDFSICSFQFCECCGSAGYFTYTRDTRYHNKGTPNLSRPKKHYGYRIGGYMICRTCFGKIEDALRTRLEGVKAELPQALTSKMPEHLKELEYKCESCGWVGWEFEIGKLPALFGGYYRGLCPSCEARNLPFGKRNLKMTGNWRVVPAERKS